MQILIEPLQVLGVLNLLEARIRPALHLRYSTHLLGALMSDGPVKIEIGAKATLEIKAEVPKESAGRMVDALTDLVRPWSEARGLRADMIRLHREDVALQIA